MPKKPVPILKRNARIAKSSKGGKPRRLTERAANISQPDIQQGTPPAPPKPEPVLQETRQYPFWTCQSEVDRQAAACLSKILASDTNKRNGKTIKSLTLAPHIKAKKAVYAVTCQTLSHLPVIQQVLSKTTLLNVEQLRPAVAFVITYELLFGQGCRIKGKAEKAIFGLKAELQEYLQAILTEAGVEHVDELLSANIAKDWPRTARVNLLKISVAEALAWLRSPPLSHQKLATLGNKATVDELLPDVLLFPAGTDLHDHPLVTSGSLILQSKASCLPAHALAAQPGWQVVDACAAPGNKTTHVAALMGGKGSVLAFDRDPKRLDRLKANAAATGATNIVAQQADFLSLDMCSDELREVRGVMLDPSCSGSGTCHSRMDHLLPSKGQAAAEQEAARLQSLAAFQTKALRHALTLPKLERLVYSTCSIHDVENELVVKAVLEEAQELGFHLADPFPSWPRRGLPLLPGHHHLIRVDPEKDKTDGFFVAVFQRSSS